LHIQVSVVATTMVLDPTGLMPTLGVMVGPVDNAATLVPDVLALEDYGIPWVDRDARGEITVVGHENRETVRDADQKSLVPGTLRVIR